MKRERLFRVCDLVVESNIPLPELPLAEIRIPDCRFRLLDAGAPHAGDFRWFNHWRLPEEEQAWLSFATCDNGYVLRFAAQGDFLVSRDTSEVKCRPMPGLPQSTVRHLFLDQILPLILSRRGSLVLHASAVLTEFGVIAFVGASGRGKSTLAARFAGCGYTLVCDDYLALREVAGGWLASPSYPGVSLWPEATGAIFGQMPQGAEIAHYTVKRRISDRRLIGFAAVPAPVRCLYFLDEEGNPERPLIGSMSSREAFMKLVASAFNLDITDKTLMEWQFDAMGRAGTRLQCFHLAYPREFSMLPAVMQTIVEHHKRPTQCLSP
jgi:hypothetical protein